MNFEIGEFHLDKQTALRWLVDGKLSLISVLFFIQIYDKMMALDS